MPKTAPPTTSKEFRPISLLYHRSKIAEKFLNKELSKYTPSDDNQYAYMKNLGTVDALVKAVTYISAMLYKKYTYAVHALYLDFSKAFDLMHPDILAEKMISINIHSLLTQLVINILSGKSQCVKFSDAASPYLETCALEDICVKP